MDPTRLSRALQKPDTGFLRRPIPLPSIAYVTAADEIIPGILSSPFFRNDVVDSHWNTSATTVLTLMLVPFQNVLPGEHNIVPLNAHIFLQLDDAGEGKRETGRVNEVPVILDHLNLAQVDQADSPLSGAY